MPSDGVIQSGKVAARKIEIKLDKLEICFHREWLHHAISSLTDVREVVLVPIRSLSRFIRRVRLLSHAASSGLCSGTLAAEVKTVAALARYASSGDRARL